MKIDAHEVERRVERFKDAVRLAGVKLTHQRLEIFREVAARLDHPSAEAIYTALQARLPTISRDTVYRTLGLLQELGLVTALGPRHESVRYDANLAHHHHYVCLRCGLTRDFESPKLSRLSLPDSVQVLGSIVETQVEVRGLCRRCAKKPAD